MRPESLRSLFIRFGLSFAILAGLVACTPKGPNGPNGPSPEVAATAIVATLGTTDSLPYQPVAISDETIQLLCNQTSLMSEAYFGEDFSSACEKIWVQGGYTPPCDTANATYDPDTKQITICIDSIGVDSQTRRISVEESVLLNVSHEVDHAGFPPDLFPENVALTQIGDDIYYFIADSEIEGYRVSHIFLVYNAFDPELQREAPFITEATYNFEFFTQLVNYAVNIGLDPNTLEFRDPSLITITDIMRLITFDGYLHCSSFTDYEQEAQLDMNARIIKAIIENRYSSENPEDSYAYKIVDGLRKGNYSEVFQIYFKIVNLVKDQVSDPAQSERVALLGPGAVFCNNPDQYIPPCLKYSIVLDGPTIDEIIEKKYNLIPRVLGTCGYQP